MIFLNWNGDGISDSNSPNTTVDMTQDRTISTSYANGSRVLLLCPGEIVEDQDAGINTATSLFALMERVYSIFLRLLPTRMAKREIITYSLFQQIKKEHLRVRFPLISKPMALPYPSL